MSVSSLSGTAVSGQLPAAAASTRKAKPRWSRRVAADVVGLLDAGAVVLGAVLPALIYSRFGAVAIGWQQIVQAGLLTAIIVCFCLRGWGLYDTAAMHRFPIRVGRLLSALMIAFIAVHGTALPLAPHKMHAAVWYAVWLAASFTLLLLVRLVARTVLERCTAAGRFDSRVAVFGAGSIARRVGDHLSNSQAGISFAGVYDDRQDDPRRNAEGLTVAGRLDDLIAAGRDGRIDQIVIALPQAADRRAVEVARKLEQLPVSLHVVTHIASDVVDAGPAHRVSSLGPVGLLDIKRKPLSGWDPLLKRAEDYVLGGLLLLAAAPVMALVAAAIKLDSPGPVFFRQRRRGLNQRIIEVMKFRTMSVMEDGCEVRQATRDDPRITRVGRVLRRSSLDELPQLLNVLKGEMSLVGPRPHALVHDEQWGDMLERYANRHQVKPGITGYAQVKGWRGETQTAGKMQARVEHDLDYIANWSLALDLRILAQTLGVVVRGDNAV